MNLFHLIETGIMSPVDIFCWVFLAMLGAWKLWNLIAIAGKWAERKITSDE